MKNKFKINILFFLVALTFSYCTPKTEEQEQKQEKINWKDSRAILKAAENYYKDSTVRINRASLFVYDKRRKIKRPQGMSNKAYQARQKQAEDMLMKYPRFSARHLLFRRADTAKLHRVGKEVAWLPVIMIEGKNKDSLVVDYKVIWDEGTITFSGDKKIVGAFRVTEVIIQKADGEKRYEWVEDDGYWEKQLVRDKNM